jgi:hypothetical protein
MEKKVFEAPEVNVTLFEEADILTLSTGKDGQIPETDFGTW